MSPARKRKNKYQRNLTKAEKLLKFASKAEEVVGAIEIKKAPDSIRILRDKEEIASLATKSAKMTIITRKFAKAMAATGKHDIWRELAFAETILRINSFNEITF